MDEPEPEQMKKLKSDNAKRGGSWNIPTSDQMFGWLTRWNWMATLFGLVTVGIAAQTIIDSKVVPDPGKISVLWLVPIFLTTVGLNAVKEFYERQREREQETKNATAAAENTALQAEVKALVEQLGSK